MALRAFDVEQTYDANSGCDFVKMRFTLSR